MKILIQVATTLLVFLFSAGCAGPSLADRIDDGMRDFDSWPAEVQKQVRSGNVEVGFSKPQVRMAWGEPDHIQGNLAGVGDSELWLWEKKTPQLGIGVGVGTMGRRNGVSGSVGTLVGGDVRVKREVMFKDGVVVSFSR